MKGEKAFNNESGEKHFPQIVRVVLTYTVGNIIMKTLGLILQTMGHEVLLHPRYQ